MLRSGKTRPARGGPERARSLPKSTSTIPGESLGDQRSEATGGGKAALGMGLRGHRLVERCFRLIEVTLAAGGIDERHRRTGFLHLGPLGEHVVEARMGA